MSHYNFVKSFSAGIVFINTSEYDVFVFRRQILTYKNDPRAERVKMHIAPDVDMKLK